jgi:hypothetical protein
MFLWRNGEKLWVTWQTDHMVQVGEIGRAWGNDQFAVPRRTGALTAARLHDEGWTDIDLNPDFDAETGLPFELTGKVFGSVFGGRGMPASHYGRGVDLVLGVDPYAALLTSMHGTGVYLRDYGIDGQEIPDTTGLEPAGRAFLDEQEDLQRRLRKETEASDEEVWHDFRLLIAWNRLSQIFSRGLTRATLSMVPTVDPSQAVDILATRVDTYTVALHPYPFRTEPELFPVRTYALDDRRYESSEDFVASMNRTAPFSAVYRAIRA